MYNVGDRVRLREEKAVFGVGGVSMLHEGVIVEIMHTPYPARYETSYYAKGEMIGTRYSVQWPTFPGGGWVGAYYDLVLVDSEEEGCVPCPPSLKRRMT